MNLQERRVMPKIVACAKINKQRVLFLGKTSTNKIYNGSVRFPIFNSNCNTGKLVNIDFLRVVYVHSIEKFVDRPSVYFFVVFNMRHHSVKAFSANKSIFALIKLEKKFSPIMANRALHSFHMKSFICFLMMVY